MGPGEYCHIGPLVTSADAETMGVIQQNVMARLAGVLGNDDRQ